MTRDEKRRLIKQPTLVLLDEIAGWPAVYPAHPLLGPHPHDSRSDITLREPPSILGVDPARPEAERTVLAGLSPLHRLDLSLSLPGSALLPLFEAPRAETWRMVFPRDPRTGARLVAEFRGNLDAPQLVGVSEPMTVEALLHLAEPPRTRWLRASKGWRRHLRREKAARRRGSPGLGVTP